MRANKWSGKSGLAIAACLVMVLGIGMPVVAGAASGHPMSAPAAAPAVVSSPAKVTNAPVAANYPTPPYKGYITVDDDYGGAEATTEDPAVAYDTISVEPILNVYETLIEYNGSSSNGAGPGAFVPILTTCVPGTPQCVTDYGSDLIANNVHGQPVYYTFPIDKNARFYDQATGKSWAVYPTDVMFSMAREMAWSESYGVGTTAGWLVTQSLLPNGSATWDGGIHAPYNTTPADILGSMLINDSTYCPSAAMSGADANGCITFVVDGAGGPWPTSLFLQLVGDEFNGVVPCAWFSANGANITGWNSPDNGTSPDSSCLLPDGGTSTNNPAWTSYLAGLNPTSWDAYEELLPALYPAPNPGVQWNMTGSGPYFAVTDPTGSPPGYTLFANPAYAQPTGCSGAYGLATYGGYCWPAPGKYIQNVSVYYYSTDSNAITGYKNGQIDFGTILTSDTGELLTLANESKLNYFDVPGLSTFFLPFNLNWSLAAYTSPSNGLQTYGTPNIPADFFANIAVRNLFTHAYMYTTAEDTANTVDGIQYDFIAGGPIVQGMNYYPTNISYPMGNAVNNSAIVGSAAYWWKVGTTPGSGYYDAELAACLTTTCKPAIVGETGAPNLDAGIKLWIKSIEQITSYHIQPFTFDLPFSGVFPSLIYSQLATTPDNGPLDIWNLGWAADNYDPEDYMIPMAFPNSTYTLGDAVEEQLALPQYNSVSCGHTTANFANLSYWATHQTNTSCEGIAYSVVSGEFYNSTHATNTTLRAELYWGIQAVLNSLGLYVWFGQANVVPTFAPWISGASLNTGATIGGGGDQLWFQIRYVPWETLTTFTETGLPGGTTFNMTAGTPALHYTSNGTASTSFYAPNGTLKFQFSDPPGYVVTAVKGGSKTTTDSTNIIGKVPTTLAVTFSPLEPLYFNETGLKPGTTWGVGLTYTSKTGPPDGNPADASMSATTNGTSIEFNVSGSWKYVVTVPANYKVSSPKGSESVKTMAKSKALKFTLITGKVAIGEAGLGKGAVWTGFVVTGATNLTTVCSYSGPKKSATCLLESGTYVVTANAVVGYTAPAPVTITVTAPKGQKVTLTYT